MSGVLNLLNKIKLNKRRPFPDVLYCRNDSYPSRLEDNLWPGFDLMLIGGYT